MINVAPSIHFKKFSIKYAFKCIIKSIYRCLFNLSTILGTKTAADRRWVFRVYRVPTISLSVSVFEKQWPFMTGLEGSLSDNTMTSSGDGGCRSFLMSL